MSIRQAETAAEIERCWSVMAQLRAHLSAEAFVVQVQRQIEADRYRLAFLEADGAVSAVAGYRAGENLAWGRFVYVDDLVTDGSVRSAGHGGQLLDWLLDEARRLGCGQLHLDSGVQRFAAHRFYLNRRMEIRSHHFSIEL